MKSSPSLKSFRDKSVDQVSASVYSVEMQMFAYANVSWAVGSKEPWLDGLASFVRPLDGERLGAQGCVCVCVRGGGGARRCGWGTVSHRPRGWKTKVGVGTAEERGERRGLGSSRCKRGWLTESDLSWRGAGCEG